ncbi:3-beta hydroxysteroid dehydrogenase/isomerase [Wallemia mellicola]|nr:3-beta hydroxysteroid dehydrogenase/isomerase [Wallemia mellicola]
MKDTYLVVGGSGFLGNHIAEALKKRGDTVFVTDLVQRHFDNKIEFYSADLTKKEQLNELVSKLKPSCIIHTASPIHGLGQHVYKAVNVDGTSNLLEVAKANDVKKFVFTSSAGTVYDGSDLIDVDERCPYPHVAMDAYNETKAQAEKIVLDNNDDNGLRTCAIRPAGIFGPGDRQVLAGLLKVVENNQTKYQIGNNDNLFDWTYVGNVVHAHLLAADKLNDPPIDPAVFKESIGFVTPTVQDIQVPTSRSKNIGPHPTRDVTDEETAFALTYNKGVKEVKPVIRTKFDQYFEPTKPEVAPSLKVAGNAFFVTNGEPIYFWDFPRAVWRGIGHIPPKPTVLPSSFGYYLGAAAEAFAWITGRDAGFTRYRVKYASSSRYYNIEKARRVLGYEPIVGIEEGIAKTLDWYKTTQVKS